MPILGYGVYQVTKEECERCVLDALKVGYRAIDTAQSYFNEEEVGNAIQKSGIPREEIFLTTKVWVEHYGYEEAKKSVLESMKKLKTDYLDLVLLHQPFSDAYGAYHALEDLYDEGKIRAIGISNFYVDRMVDFASFNRIKPMVNQVETHISVSYTHLDVYKRQVPLTIAQLIQLLYNVVDRIYIGHLPGTQGEALTGVGLVFPSISMIAAFTLSLIHI